MHNKHKFFILGIIIGFGIPFIENILEEKFDPEKPFAKLLVFGGSLWHYAFLYIVVINSIVLYVQRLSVKINPESKFVFFISGVSSGFALISIVAANVELIIK